VDSADTSRMEEVNRELAALLDEEKLAGVPLLVFANKQDLMGALTAEEISTGLNLSAITGRSWFIQACSAKRGDGLEEGMSWCVRNVKEKSEAEAAT
jgi:ADP-ribosylation factor-like protein 3